MLKKVLTLGVTNIAIVFAACLVFCAGCGTPANADMPKNAGNGKVDGSMVSQASNAGEGGDRDRTASGTGNRESGNKDIGGVQSGAGAGKDKEWTDLPPEEMFSYEEKDGRDGAYLTVTGIARESRESLETYLTERAKQGYKGIFLKIPEEIGGIPVREIGKEAFADMGTEAVGFQLPDTVTVIGDGAFRDTEISGLGLGLPFGLEIIGAEAFRNTGVRSMNLPSCLEEIGAGAFENCRLERIQIPASTVTVGERAFAGNRDMWTALVQDAGTVLEKDVFADSGCGGQFLLCSGDSPAGGNNPVAEYAKEYGYEYMEIMVSREPIVHYYEEPPVLQPRVDNFFYGEDGDEETEQWCSWEYDENAPNFGYEDWQWPGCSSWCGAVYFEQEAEATSELASKNGRYSAENVLEQSRMAAWAEGVEGHGIGESITYRQTYAGGLNNKWEAMGPEYREPEIDGFIRYTELCIVNGYAKDRKTWEENGRVRTLLLYVEDRLYARLELEDTILPQYFALPEDDIKVLSGGTLEVRFEIAEVYPGSVYEDTCLTGLVMEFSGRFAH